MPRKNKILIRTGSTAPAAVDFVTSEPAWDSTAGVFYVKNAAGTMVQVGPNTASATFTGTTTFTGSIVVPDGSATAPSVRGTTYSTTGIYFDAGGDRIHLTTGGTRRLSLTSTAQVQIVGTGTAAAPILCMGNSTTTGTFTPATNEWAVSTNGVERFNVNAAGNVRIGNTASAIATLDLQVANTETYPIVSSGLSGASRASILVRNTSSTTGSFAGYSFFVNRADGGTQVASIGAVSNEDTVYSPHLVFTVRSSSGNQTERMRIAAGGNVGIGTNNPTSPLHVVGTVDCDGLIVGTTTASATGIALLGAADAAAGRTTLSAAAATHTHAASDITSGTIATARLGSGTADATTFLRGDGAWATPSSSSSVVSAATPSSFPGTGAVNTLYLATDTGRIYHWVSGTGYVEAGPVGGGDTALWSLFLPPAPTSVSGTSGSGQVALSWTAPTVAAQTPITDYVVQYSSNSGSTWTTFSDGTSTATSATVNGLTNGTAYTFRVAAVNAVGTGTYSAATASITAGSDSLYSSVQILLHCDGANNSTTFTDNSGTPKTITVGGGAVVSTAQSKFGGASAYFNGTTDSLSFADVTLGTGDFTVEMFFKTASSVQYAQLIGNETSSSATGYTLLINNNSSTGGQIAVYRQGNLVVQSSSGDWSDDAWHHVALTRSGTTVTLWIDGTSYGTATDTNSYSGGTYYIGRNNIYAPRNMIGYIDEVRITKAARYTSAFTPTTVAFSNS